MHEDDEDKKNGNSVVDIMRENPKKKRKEVSGVVVHYYPGGVKAGAHGDVYDIDEKCNVVKDLMFLMNFVDDGDRKPVMISENMVVKIYKADCSIYYYLMKFISSTDANVINLKEALVRVYGLKLDVVVNDDGVKVTMKMRKFIPLVKSKDQLLNVLELISLFEVLKVSHSDIKPDNIMMDSQGVAWLVDLDNVICQSVGGDISCDSRFYKFDTLPSLSDRIALDRLIASSYWKGIE
jgi:serine/threonine protein kinase